MGQRELTRGGGEGLNCVEGDVKERIGMEKDKE